MQRRHGGSLLVTAVILVISSSASGALVPSSAHRGSDASCNSDDFIHEFPLGSVTLAPASLAAKSAELNRQFLLMIDPDSLLWTFHKNAGLQRDKGEPYWRSWEDPAVEVRGEFTGHYLSATALYFNYTGDEAVRKKSLYLVSELKKVQDAIGTGYLSAFPMAHFDRLESLQSVWAPYYVIHKLMAGLLDQYLLADNDLALSIVLDMADYFVARIDDVIRVNGTARWHETLEVEYGGMQEVLTKLHSLTHEKEYLRVADLFVKATFYDPLVQNQDVLENRHANTHLAQVNGFAARFEYTGDAASRAAVANFYQHLTTAHSYASGGSNDNEVWGVPMELGASFEKDKGVNTQETCTTYNVLKLARSLFRWTGDSKFADFYERALTNGILGIARMPPQLPLSEPPLPLSEPPLPNAAAGLAASDVGGGSRYQAALHSRQRPLAQPRKDTNKPGPGVYLYHMPMGRSGVAKADNFHGWGYRFSSFWCCYGTAVESLAKLADSIFFWKQKCDAPPVLYVNQLQPAMLRWEALDLNVTLRSSLLDDAGIAVASLAFDVGGPAPRNMRGAKSEMIRLKVRLPEWTEPDAVQLALDGEEVQCAFEASDDKGYCTITSAFRSGQRLDIKLPMQPRLETLQDARPVFQVFKSVLIGPHLYAGLTHDSRVVVADPAKITSLVSPASSEGHLSLAPAWAPQGVFLRHDAGGLYTSEVVDRGDALDATFRLVPGLSTTQDRPQEPLSLAALQEWLYRNGSPPPAQLVSLEGAGSPGEFVGVELARTGLLEPQKRAAVLSHRPAGRQARQAHTFWLRRGLTGELGTLSLELAAKPGTFLANYIPEDSGSCRWMDAQTCKPGSKFARIDCPASCAAWVPAIRRLKTVRAPPEGTVAPVAWAADATFHVRPPQGRLPEGSKMLHGDVRSYIISPLSSIVDERYTAYFEWYHPEGRYPKEKQYQLERKSWRLFISTPFFKMVLAIFALIFAFVVLFVANEVYDDWKPARWRAAWAAEDAVEQADKQAAKQAAGNSTLAAPQPVSQPRLNMAVAAPSKPAAGTPGPQPAMYRQQSAAGAARKQTAAPVAPGDTAANALLQTLQHSGTTAVPSGGAQERLDQQSTVESKRLKRQRLLAAVQQEAIRLQASQSATSSVSDEEGYAVIE